MRMIDQMKDEKLGSAILYNFTLGYDKPVPMELYNYVLPFIFHDAFRGNIMHASSFRQCVEMCYREDYHCIEEFKDAIVQDEMVTSRSLGLALVNRWMSFEMQDEKMVGFSHESTVMRLNEPYRLGEWFREMTIEEIMEDLVIERERIVILETNSIGTDMDLSKYDQLGEVNAYPSVREEEIPSLIKDATILVINKTVLNEDVLKYAKKLKLICLFATGYNNVDINYCRHHGIMVSNVRGYSTPSVAQHTFSLLFYLYEKLPYYDHYVKSGRYSRDDSFTYFEKYFNEIEGKTWGIVGLGDIGRRVATIAEAFGAHVIYYSTSGNHDDDHYERVDFDTLLSQSDIISIHAPLNKNTYHLFDEDAFKKMKNTAYLINVARGAIIVEEDLAKALVDNEIAGAGLDVLETEPMAKNNVLLGIRNSMRLIITPHIAWASVESRTRCVEEVYLNIESFLSGQGRNLVGRADEASKERKI